MYRVRNSIDNRLYIGSVQQVRRRRPDTPPRRKR